MIYEDHLRGTEASGWTIDSIRWDAIDRGIARDEPDILTGLRDAAMIEGYLPTFAPRMMLLLWDDVDATAILSMRSPQRTEIDGTERLAVDQVDYSQGVVRPAAVIRDVGASAIV